MLMARTVLWRGVRAVLMGRAVLMCMDTLRATTWGELCSRRRGACCGGMMMETVDSKHRNDCRRGTHAICGPRRVAALEMQREGHVEANVGSFAVTCRYLVETVAAL